MRVFLLLLGLIPLLAMGDIYKYVHPDGSVEYSDHFREGAVEVEVVPLQTYSPPPQPKVKVPSNEEKPPPEPSFQIAIIKPQDDSTVRENTGRVEVKLRVDPPLEPDFLHTIRLLLDDQPVADIAASLKHTLKKVERGTHTLQVELLNPQGAVVARSDPVTFHLHQMSSLFWDKRNGPPGGVQQAPRAPQMPRMPGPPNPGGVPFPQR
jgi:hypothetical protein